MLHFSTHKYFSETPTAAHLIADWSLGLKRISMIFFNQADSYLARILEALNEKCSKGFKNPSSIFIVAPQLTSFAFDLAFAENIDFVLEKTIISFLSEYAELDPILYRYLLISVRRNTADNIPSLKFYGKLYNGVYKETQVEGSPKIEEPEATDWNEEHLLIQFRNRNLIVRVKIV